MPSFIPLHHNLRIKEQRRRVKLIFDFYKTESALETLRIYSTEDLTEVFEKDAALHFALGYAAALKNFAGGNRNV